jgi:hypothetical protein
VDELAREEEGAAFGEVGWVGLAVEEMEGFD